MKLTSLLSLCLVIAAAMKVDDSVMNSDSDASEALSETPKLLTGHSGSARVHVFGRNQRQRVLMWISLAVAALMSTALVAFAALTPARAAGSRSDDKAAPRSAHMELSPQPLHLRRKLPCSFNRSTRCPAKSLLDSSSVRSAVTNYLVMAGLDPEMKSAIREEVDSVFGNISFRLEEHSPDFAMELLDIQLSEAEQFMILESLWLMNDPRVQRVGRKAALALNAAQSEDRFSLARQLEMSMKTMDDEIRALEHELVPLDLRSLWGLGSRSFQNDTSAWEMTLDKANINSMQRGDEEDLVEEGKRSYNLVHAMFAGALVEGRAVLDLLQMVVRQKRPDGATDFSNTLEFGFFTRSLQKMTA